MSPSRRRHCGLFRRTVRQDAPSISTAATVSKPAAAKPKIESTDTCVQADSPQSPFSHGTWSRPRVRCRPRKQSQSEAEAWPSRKRSVFGRVGICFPPGICTVPRGLAASDLI